MSDCTSETTIIWSKDERAFIDYVLRTAREESVNVERLETLLSQAVDENAEIVDTSNDLISDPPTPSELHEQLSGQRHTLSRDELDALQITVSFYVMALTQAGDANSDDLDFVHSVIISVKEKLQTAYDSMDD